MKTLLAELNWWAIPIATIAYSAFSGIWHRSFAFGKKWEQAMGFKRPDNWTETTIYYVVPLISCFTTTVAVGLLMQLAGLTSLKDVLVLGLMTGIGFAGAVTCTNSVIPIMKKPLQFAMITGTAHVLGILLVHVLLYWLNP